VAYSNYLALESSLCGLSINIGSGESHSIQELADMISDKQVYLPPREHDLKDTLADLARCRSCFNWVPQISFQQGMKDLIHSNT
jgi:UDP-glucose 4-epimerase